MIQTTISLAKLRVCDSDNMRETEKFIKQMTTHGWCRINELTGTIKPTESKIRAFFNESCSKKTTYSNPEGNIGYIWCSTNERVRALTGKIYERITTPQHSKLASDIIDNTLCNNMDTTALQIFKMICKHIIKQDWIKISSQNEICLTRNYFYRYQLSAFIASNWSNHKFICNDIILLISRYYAAANRETFNYNYGMFEAIKYNQPIQKGSCCVNEHFDVGFCVLGIGETCQGLQLFDRVKNEYINADFSNNCIYIWLGANVYELCNGAVPVGLHRVKWYNKSRISYLYEICVGQQIQSLSFLNNENMKKPYKCLKKLISPIAQQQDLLQNVIVKKASMLIKVKSLTGCITAISVGFDGTVKDIKRGIQEQDGIPCERMIEVNFQRKISGRYGCVKR